MSRNKRVLVIEDEFEVGLDIQHSLSNAGFDVLGPCTTLEAAFGAAEAGEFDAAVVDANLNGQNSGSVAEVLIRKHIPFMVISGYAREFLPLAAANAPLLGKPFDTARLVTMVRKLCFG